MRDRDNSERAWKTSYKRSIIGSLIVGTSWITFDIISIANGGSILQRAIQFVLSIGVYLETFLWVFDKHSKYK